MARIVDAWEDGFGWLTPEPAIMERASHALAAEGRVYVVDPVAGEGIEERILELGRPAAVVQLLDRHERDCAAFAHRLGVPHLRVPRSLPEPLEARIVVDLPRWREVALWWPQGRVLVCADALGTASYFRAVGERLGVHPFLRAFPPPGLRGLAPERILVGHGEGIHGETATGALEEALATSRRRLPRWLLDTLRRRRR